MMAEQLAKISAEGMTISRRLFIGYFLSFFLCVKAIAEPLQLLYIQRPPFAYDWQGQPKGLIIELIEQVSRELPLEVEYLDAKNWNNVLQLLKKRDNVCYLGGYKTKVRTLIYQFSIPIYIEAPYLVVANRKLQQHFGDSVALDTLLGSDFILGTQNGFSYGAIVDEKLQLYQTPRAVLSYITTKGKTHSERHVFSLINKARIDYILLNAEEYWWNLANSVMEKDNITSLSLRDSLPGIDRYLMCSKAVSQATLEHLNLGIAQLKASSRYQEIIDQYRH